MVTCAGERDMLGLCAADRAGGSDGTSTGGPRELVLLPEVFPPADLSLILRE
jgi:hypothetical protein